LDNLIKPIEGGCDGLKIISGYSTAAMAFKHLVHGLDLNPKLSIQLVVGMCRSDGMSLSNHRGFVKLVTDDFKGRFACSYVFNNRPVHSKAYIWFRGSDFVESYIGSANYTQNAFFGGNRELMVSSTDAGISDYFGLVDRDSIFCDNPEAEHLVQIYRDQRYRQNLRRQDEIDDSGSVFPDEKRNLEHVNVSFLAKDGTLPSTSGLNWGQRDGREKNQAYIPLKADVYSTEFFPPNTIHFTINTDDNKSLIATRAQDNGKAIHTPHNNSLIGEYFRIRLGLPSGAFVNKSDLENYGRTDIDFYKIDDETFYMDFSV
jgi:hypothetical protein